MLRLAFVLIPIFLSSLAFSQVPRGKNGDINELTFEDLLLRYLQKQDYDDMEAIYSVSGYITRVRSGIFREEGKEKVLAKQDSYAKVVLIRVGVKDPDHFLVLSMSYRDPNRFPIVGEMHWEDGQLFYVHFEPNGELLRFTMTAEEGMMRGEYNEKKGNKTLTYSITLTQTSSR